MLNANRYCKKCNIQLAPYEKDVVVLGPDNQMHHACYIKHLHDLKERADKAIAISRQGREDVRPAPVRRRFRLFGRNPLGR